MVQHQQIEVTSVSVTECANVCPICLCVGLGLLLERDREAFRVATVEPVHQLKDDLSFRMDEAQQHLTARHSDWEQVIEQVRVIWHKSMLECPSVWPQLALTELNLVKAVEQWKCLIPSFWAFNNASQLCSLQVPNQNSPAHRTQVWTLQLAHTMLAAYTQRCIHYPWISCLLDV